jgi:hypothetical protein
MLFPFKNKYLFINFVFHYEIILFKYFNIFPCRKQTSTAVRFVTLNTLHNFARKSWQKLRRKAAAPQSV